MNIWEKYNPALYLKIVQYDPKQSEDPQQLKNFLKQKYQLFLQIEEKTKKQTNNYTFPKKITQNPISRDPDQIILTDELSQKTYDLYSQNTKKNVLNDTKNSSFFAAKLFNKNEILVKKNNPRQKYNSQNHLASQLTKSFFDNSLETKMINKNQLSIVNDGHHSQNHKQIHRNSTFRKIPSAKRDFNSSQSEKGIHKLSRQFSGSSLKSNQNKLPVIEKSEKDWKKPIKSRFKQP